jgi:hypothetical protein
VTRESNRNIRPFRGIKPNAGKGRIKFVTGRVFSEDIAEDLHWSTGKEDDTTPKQITKKKYW